MHPTPLRPHAPCRLPCLLHLRERQAGPKGSVPLARAGVAMQAVARAARMRGFIGGGSVVGLKGKPSGYAERHQNQGRGDTDH